MMTNTRDPQAFRTRVQSVTARLGSEVRDGGVAREMEDAVNELQRQMGELERSVDEHRRTLDMSRRLQRAVDEVRRCRTLNIKPDQALTKRPVALRPVPALV